MMLTIWRHGEAEEGVNDRLRELTESGRDDVGFGSHRFHEACSARNIPSPHTILHSPLVRTVQTAELVSAAFTHATMTSIAALQPGGEVAAVNMEISLIDADVQNEHVLLISHQPLVSRLVDYYLGAGHDVPFLPPGGLVTLSLEHLEPACGQLLFWALPPQYEAGA